MASSKLFPLLAVMLLAALSVRAATTDTPKRELAPGQMWSIKSALPTTTKVIIGRVEPWNGKVAVSISLTDVPVPASPLGPARLTTVQHMPFEQSALAVSVDQLLATDVAPVPGFENGYAQWQSAKGGIFTISVSDPVATLIATLTRGRT